MIFYPYQPSNKESLIHIFRLNVPNYFDASEEKEFSNYLQLKPDTYFCIFNNGTMVGGVGYDFKVEDQSGRINWIFLHPNYKGNGLGKNIQAMLINRGLTEMIHLGKAMGAISSKPFLGTAGIADLIATATSTNSRNFTFGYRIGQGEKMDEILRTMPEQPEGVRTLKIARHLSKSYKLHVSIIQMVYSVVFQGLDIEKAITFLMEYPYAIDVDFI